MYLLEKAKISEEGKDLLKRLLCVDPYNRISAEQAIQHKWIKLHDKSD